MKLKRFLACAMSVVMIGSTLPAVTFAEEAEDAGEVIEVIEIPEITGELKLKGDIKVGEKITADYEKIAPEFPVTDEDVTFLWTKISEEDLTWLKESEDHKPEDLKFPELGKEKEYEIKAEDEGFYLILVITVKDGKTFA
ncbi:MAG: hypothetical protein KBT01_02910, partial [Clostridiales bacterium]|nr:hypothetical protein [Candidatus Blautia equi]